MSHESFIAAVAKIGIVIIISSLLSGAVERTGLPQVAIFLLVGVVLGPAGLDLIRFTLESPALQVIATLGLVLVLFSDGITEAENSKGVPFDEAGAQAVIAAYADRPPEAIGRAMLAAVESHAGDARLADDLTALVLKRAI